jgi:phthiodiolone/phenolphthiodiolone dimycocerosates ketoreductase
MIDFGVGVMHNTINSRFGPKPLVHADYMTGLACGADSFWVANHLGLISRENPFPSADREEIEQCR